MWVVVRGLVLLFFIPRLLLLSRGSTPASTGCCIRSSSYSIASSDFDLSSDLRSSSAILIVVVVRSGSL